MRNGFLLDPNRSGGIGHVAGSVCQIPKPLHQRRHFHDPGLRLIEDDPHHDAKLCLRRGHLIDGVLLRGFQRSLQGLKSLAGLVGVLEQARQPNGHFPDMRPCFLSRVRHRRDGFRHGHDCRSAFSRRLSTKQYTQAANDTRTMAISVGSKFIVSSQQEFGDQDTVGYTASQDEL